VRGLQGLRWLNGKARRTVGRQLIVIKYIYYYQFLRKNKKIGKKLV